MLVNNDLYKKSSKTQKIRCEICANYCKISDGSFGGESGYSLWWLRSPNPYTDDNVYRVISDGDIDNHYVVSIGNRVIRPALWINL